MRVILREQPRALRPTRGRAADSFQSRSISSKDLFFVSGRKRQANAAWAKAMAARKLNVATLPIWLKASGKKRTTAALATHCVSTGTVIATPRIRLGKISGRRVQKTGPMQDSKKAR